MCLGHKFKLDLRLGHALSRLLVWLQAIPISIFQLGLKRHGLRYGPRARRCCYALAHSGVTDVKAPS